MNEPIIALVVFLIVAVLILRFLKHIFLAVFLVILLFVLGSAGTGFLVYKDVMDMRQNIPASSNLILLEDQEKLITGLQITAFDEESVSVLDNKIIESYQNDFASGNYDKILGDNYKLFIIKLDAFSGVGNITFEGTTFSEEEIFGLLSSDDVMETLYEMMLPEQGIGLDTEEGKTAMKEALAEQFADQNEIKSLFAALLFIDKLEEEGPLFLIAQIKNGNVVVYPETITFKLMKLIPLALFNKAAKLE